MAQSYSLPSWVFKQMGPMARHFEMQQSSLDGNCFFQSMRMILNSAGIVKTVDELRRVVALPILNERDEIVNRTLQNWWELYQDGKKESNQMLMEEYKHMACLPDNTTFPLGEQERKVLYGTMLTPQYWGEQHACRIIEEQTQMRFLIFNDDTQLPSLTWYHSKAFQPTFYCFLFITRQHYMPVSFSGNYIFEWESIPYDVQMFFSKAYVSPKEESNSAVSAASSVSPSSDQPQ